MRGPVRRSRRGVANCGRRSAYAADHLSLYQLTIEPGTAFEARARRGELVLPDGDAAAELYLATAEAAARFGLAAYEVSNYARPGAESRHNLAYWRYGDYAGIGPGAHGRLTLGAAVVATRRHRAPEPWAERVEREGHGTAQEEALAPQERAREMLLMGLRLAEGIEPARFAARTGIALADALDAGTLARAEAEGYLGWRDGRLAATARGPAAAGRAAAGLGELTAYIGAGRETRTKRIPYSNAAQGCGEHARWANAVDSHQTDRNERPGTHGAHGKGQDAGRGTLRCQRARNPSGLGSDSKMACALQCRA